MGDSVTRWERGQARAADYKKDVQDLVFGGTQAFSALLVRSRIVNVIVARWRCWKIALVGRLTTARCSPVIKHSKHLLAVNGNFGVRWLMVSARISDVFMMTILSDQTAWPHCRNDFPVFAFPATIYEGTENWRLILCI